MMSAMAAAARLDPKSFFTAEEWAPLSARSSWKGAALIAHAWAMIIAAGAMVVVWPVHPAARGDDHRRAPAGPGHPDARRRPRRAAQNLKVNDLMGDWLTGGGLHRYRPYHLTHHRFAQQGEDPDLGLSAPFPITPISLRRKIVRDLTGQTFFKQRFGRLRQRRLRTASPGEPLLPIIGEEIRRKRRWLAFGLIVTAIGAPFGLWWLWPVLWVLPQATWYPMVTRLRNIAEHACIAKDEPDPMRQARTTKASLLERLLIAPYYVNYHCEHHMFMHLPCYSLPKAHRILATKRGDRRHAGGAGRLPLGAAQGLFQGRFQGRLGLIAVARGPWRLSSPVIENSFQGRRAFILENTRPQPLAAHARTRPAPGRRDHADLADDRGGPGRDRPAAALLGLRLGQGDRRWRAISWTIRKKWRASTWSTSPRARASSPSQP